MSELPFSFLLAIADISGPKWDNSDGIADMNDEKIAHQSEMVNLNTAIFVELKGCIKTWFRDEDIPLSEQEVGLYALQAQYHWHQMPSSQALPTLRILSSLYGLMRFDPQRRYHNGDVSDFMIAASALPVADAFFTDRNLARFLFDKRIGLDRFSDCSVVSGFKEMAEHLEKSCLA